MTLPNPTNGAGNLVPITNTGPQANQDNPLQATTKINNSVAALLANDVGLDARLAVLEASNLPPGAYVVPSANAQFIYSGNANPWSQAVMQTRASFGLPAQAATNVWAVPVSVGNTASGSVNTFLVIWAEGNGTNGATAHAVKAVLVTVDQAGNQTLSSVVNLATNSSTSTSSASFYVAGAFAISSNVIKIVSYYILANSSSISAFNITYDGSSTLTSSSSTIPQIGFSNPFTENPQLYGCLCGTSSACFYSGGVSFSSTYTNACVIMDRSTQTNNNVPLYDPYYRTGGVVDYIGNAQALEAYGMATTQDTTKRLTVRWNSMSDVDRQVGPPLRVTGFAFNTLYALTAWSATLFDVTWTDSGNAKHTSLFTNNNGVLALIGTYSNNNAIVFPLFWQMFSATVKFGISAGAAVNQFLFSPLTYNPAATQPGTNDLTGSTNFSYTFGNVASAVQSTLKNVIRLTPNMVAMVGYGGTSSSKTVISETVVLS